MDFDPSILKVDEKPSRNINTYYIRNTSTKDSKYINIYSLNLLCLIIGEIDGSIEWSSTEEKIVIDTFIKNVWMSLNITLENNRWQ